MTATAQARFTSWIRTEIAPFLRDREFKGSGSTFDRRIARNWLLVHIEKNRYSDAETIQFRISVGVASAAILAAHGDDPDRRPSGYTAHRMFGPLSLYDPPGGFGFYRFGAGDAEGTIAGLAEHLRAMLGEAIDEGIENVDDGAILAARLSIIGPLENESPHGIGELAALARSTGDDDLLARIAAAQDRPRVPDPLLEAERRRALEIGLEITGEMGGSISLGSEFVTTDNIDRLAAWEPPDFHLPDKTSVGRQSATRSAKLIVQLESGPIPMRRWAAFQLGGWNLDPAILDALRSALNDPDRYVVQTAIQSLGLLGDIDPATWETSVDVLEHETIDEWGGGLLSAYGTTQMALMDPPRRLDRTRAAIERLLEIDLAGRRSYRLLLDRLAN